MNYIHYNIRPSYINTENGIREFQKAMKDFLEDKEHSVMVLKAPTGSGKTFGFYMLNEKNNVLIIMPNNELVEQVYNDIKKMGKNVKKITASDLDLIENSKGIDRKSAFNSLISSPFDDNYFVVTNPEILLRLVINKYTISDRMDEISLLRKNGFNLIIIDEFHVYNIQQLKEIAAIVYILQRSFKILLTSATPNYSFLEPLEKAIGENRIIKYNVKRQIDGSDIIQGPLCVNIYYNQKIEDFIDENIKSINNGKWLFILDKIICIEMVYNKLLNHKVNPNDISLFDGYHNDKNWNRRIILSSNILEQGINIPATENVVIEPGKSAVNLEQRLGRVGRGRSEYSNVYIILKNISEKNFDCKIENYDKLIDKFYQVFPKRERKFGEYSLGVQIAKIAENFSYRMRYALYREFIKDHKEIRHGYLDFIVINNAILKNNLIKNNKKVANVIQTWWNNYKETMETFINGDRKIKIKDLTLDGKDIDTEYSEIWIRRFKDIVGNKALNSRSKPLKISLKVSGIPFCNMVIDYSEIYNARKKIKDCADVEISEIRNLFTNIIFDEKLKDIIYSTADQDRLKVISIED